MDLKLKETIVMIVSRFPKIILREIVYNYIIAIYE